MNKYSIYCTPSQTKKALELGAQIRMEIDIFSPNIENLPTFRDVKDNDVIIFIPTAEQIIGVLESLGVWVEPIKIYTEDKELYSYNISWDFQSRIECEIRHINDEMPHFNSRKEATLAAVDAALDYLSKIDNK